MRWESRLENGHSEEINCWQGEGRTARRGEEGKIFLRALDARWLDGGSGSRVLEVNLNLGGCTSWMSAVSHIGLKAERLADS